MASPIPVHFAASTSTILPSALCALCAVSTSISQWGGGGGGGSGGHAGVNVVQRKETRRSSSSTTTTLLNLEVAAQVRVSEFVNFASQTLFSTMQFNFILSWSLGENILGPGGKFLCLPPHCPNDESTHFLKGEGTVRVGASEKGLGFRIIRVSPPT
jgi:hypothetical protein